MSVIARERIGEAYVRIVADGSGMDKQIKDELKKSDEAFHTAGKTSADRWQKGFDDEIEQQFGKNFHKSWEKAFTQEGRRMDATARKLADEDFWQPFRDTFEKRFGSRDLRFGDQLLQNLKDDFARAGGDAKVFEDFAKRIRENIRKATDQVRRMKIQIAPDVQIGDLRNVGVQFNELHGILDRLNSSADETTRTMKTVSEEIKKVSDNTDEATKHTESFWSRIRRIRSDAAEAEDGLTRMTHGAERFSEVVGRGLGRGGRNDFLNVIGRIGQAIAGIPALLLRGGQGVFNFGQSLVNAAKEGETFGQSFGNVAGVLASSVGSLGAAIGAIGIASVGLVAVLGPLASALSLLAGAVVALASSLSFALVGAVGAAAGAMVPLAAGIGVAVAAIMSADKQTKNAFKPLLGTLKDLGHTAATHVFADIHGQVSDLDKVLRGLQPTVARIGNALSDSFGNFVDSLSGPSWRNFFTTLNRTAPRMIRTIGDIAVRTGEVLADMWSAGAPFVQQFLNWIDRGITAIEKWGKKVEGASDGLAFLGRGIKPDDRNNWTKFWQSAADSLESVWGFLKQIGGLIGDIVTAGRGTGDNLFDSMASSIAEFRDFLDKHPDALKNWFSDAETFAKRIGDFVVNIGRLFDALDTPKNRQLIIDVVDGLSLLVGVLSDFAGPPTQVMAAIVGFLQALGKGDWSGAATNLEDLGGALYGMLQNFLSFATFGGLQLPDLSTIKNWASEAGGAISDLARKAGGWFGGIGRSIAGPLETAFTTVKNKVTGIAHTLSADFRKNFKGISINDIFSLSGINKIIGAFTGMGRDILRHIGNIQISKNLQLKDIPGKILNVFKGLGSRALHAIGNIHVSRNLTLGDIASKVIGAFKGLGQRALHAIGNIQVSRNLSLGDIVRRVLAAFPVARTILNHIGGITVSNMLRGLASIPGMIFRAFPSAQQILNDIGSIDIGSLLTGLGNIASDIYNAFPSAQQILDSIGHIDLSSLMHGSISLPGGHKISWAQGGIVPYATYGRIGEAGPEAVVPLNRPLNQVDPSVRWLSAIAQGINRLPANLPTVTAPETTPSRVLNVGGLTVITPTADPKAVATETVNRLATYSYLS